MIKRTSQIAVLVTGLCLAISASAFAATKTPAAPTVPATPANGGQQFYAPGYGTVDLMAEYTPSQTYTVKANVTNIANKVYADQVYRGHYVPGAGRLVQVTLNAKF